MTHATANALYGVELSHKEADATFRPHAEEWGKHWTADSPRLEDYLLKKLPDVVRRIRQKCQAPKKAMIYYTGDPVELTGGLWVIGVGMHCFPKIAKKLSKTFKADAAWHTWVEET